MNRCDIIVGKNSAKASQEKASLEKKNFFLRWKKKLLGKWEKVLGYKKKKKKNETREKNHRSVGSRLCSFTIKPANAVCGYVEGKKLTKNLVDL